MHRVSFGFLFGFAWVVTFVVQQNFDYFRFVNKILQVDVLEHCLHYVRFNLVKVAVVVLDADVNLLQ